MSRIVKRSAARAIKTSEPCGRQDATLPLPQWIPPQLTQLVETAHQGRNGFMRSNSTVSEWRSGLNAARQSF
jgi:hypothetical protein